MGRVRAMLSSNRDHLGNGAKAPDLDRAGHAWPPLSLIVAPLTVAAFAVCAYAFLRDDHAIDRFVLFGVPEPFNPAGPLGPRWLVELSWEFSALGSPALVAAIALTVAGFLFMADRAGPAMYLIGSVGSGTAFGYVLKRAFGFLRPHHAPNSGFELSTSFPSGHALLVCLLGVSLALTAFRTAPASVRARFTRYGIGATMVLSLLVGVSRVHLGLHWPSDVVAGWVSGAGWAFLFWTACRRYSELRAVRCRVGAQS